MCYFFCSWKNRICKNRYKTLCSCCNLSTDYNVKQLKQLESDLKRTINWNKYQPQLKTFPQNSYLTYLIDLSFQGVSRLFVLPFENEIDREVHTKYYLPTVEIKNYNVIIDRRNFFDQPIKNNFKRYDNIRKISTVKEMFTQLDVNWTITVSRNITS